MPRALRVGQVLTTFGAAGGALGLLVVPTDVSIFSIGADAVGGLEFRRRLGLPYAAAVAALGAAAAGLWRERRWARPAMVLA